METFITPVSGSGRAETKTAGAWLTASVPDDLTCALASRPAAPAAFATLDATNRYASLVRGATCP
jgi:uncharacterized protein YdeI (YjbR/CyaY-like superfamily)